MGKFVHPEGKMYYSMGEVAEMFDVSPTLIRFWEKKFDILSPRKNARGNRMFTTADVDNLRLIYHLVKERGMTLAGAQKRLRDNPHGLRHDTEVVERLMTIKALLLEIKAELGADISASDDAGEPQEVAAEASWLQNRTAESSERRSRGAAPVEEAASTMPAGSGNAAPEAQARPRFVEPVFDFGSAGTEDCTPIADPLSARLPDGCVKPENSSPSDSLETEGPGAGVIEQTLF